MNYETRRQFIYWRTLIAALGGEKEQKFTDPLMVALVEDLQLPKIVLDERASIKQVLRQQPDLAPLVGIPKKGEKLDEKDRLKQAILFLKVVLNAFKEPGESISAKQYSQWLEDVRAFEIAAGNKPGEILRGTGPISRRGSGKGYSDTPRPDVKESLEEIDKGAGLMSIPEIQAGLKGIEKRMIDRMKLREILADAKLAAKLTPSMALTEQLLRDKNHLTGPALKQAKMLIRRFVEELGDVLAKEVASASKGDIDHSVPPKKIFRNLNLKRTIWSNLTNWDPKTKRLYVDRLFYRHRAKKINKTRLIVVVDQSGSMIPAMVNCTILASIFSGLPKIDGHLIAYDTRAIDLSKWVQDPIEVLLRTKLGGGTDGMSAIPIALSKIQDPEHTVIVWISDFYDNKALMPVFRQLVSGGITFIPVGSVSSSGYFSVCSWFRTELKSIGTPVLSGSLKTLIKELKSVLP